jgi:hypothetical protein
MKGVIVLQLKAMVIERFGKDKWEEALAKAGIYKEPIITVISNVDDKIVVDVVNSLCEVLGISLPQLGDAFGDYWVNVYTPKVYASFYANAKTAKDFLLKMDHVHVAMTKNLQDADPPRFEYEWEDNKTLIMKYISKRGLIDFMVGLIKGVGNFYKEDLKVTKLGNDRVKIVFP